MISKNLNYKFMEAPTNTKERIDAITRLVKKLSAEEQKNLYRELSKFAALEQAQKIDSSIKKNNLSIDQIVAECRASRKKVS